MTRSLRAPAGLYRTLAAGLLCSLAAGPSALPDPPGAGSEPPPRPVAGEAAAAGERAAAVAGEPAAAPRGPAAGPPNAEGGPAAGPARTETYRRIRLFDFDERPLGNFEDTPMYWTRLTGPGLPSYSGGRIDDDEGRDAPPAFLLTLRGGSIAYEYTRNDLVISPESDYVIEGWVRPEGLELARALLVCYLVDRLGARIEGSERISNLARSVASGGTGPAGWQPLRIELDVAFPEARALRLQLWVLQDHVWQPPAADEPDPIIRQDVDARVWFDDLAIYRMPRVRLTLSNPGAIVKPGAAERFEIDVQNATLAPLQAELRVLDQAGGEHLRDTHEVGAAAAARLSIGVPALPPGLYAARVRLGTPGEAVLERTLRFAVLPDLSDPEARYEDLGLDLAAWPGGGVAGACELIATLGCGSVKVGVPMLGPTATPDDLRRLEEVRALARRLVLARIETTGVMLPSGDPRVDDAASVLQILSGSPGWEERVGPLFAHLGDLLFSWQLGDEARELRRPGGWSAAMLRSVRHRIERFVAVPQLIVPRSVLDAAPAAALLGRADLAAAPAPPAQGGKDVRLAAAKSGALPLADRELPYAYSFWVPPTLPTSALPMQLAFWFEPDTDRAFEGPAGPRPPGARGPARWLALAADRGRGLTPAERVADLARRVVLAKAVNPDRLFVAAPFELTGVAGGQTWQPTDEYIPLRTLFHHLSGRRAFAALTLDPDAVGILFSGREGSALVLWTWRRASAESWAELYAGAAAQAVELSGQRRPLARDGMRIRVPLSPAPLIVEHVDAPLLLLQESFAVEPAFLQLHAPEPRPVLTLRNHYSAGLTGTIALSPPPSWSVTPAQQRIELAPGQALEQPLDFTIPPRQVATVEDLVVDVRLEQPEAVELRFVVPLRVGLKDIVVGATAWWEGGDLVVEQWLRNFAAEPVSFSAFCQVPRRPQREGVFLNVPPGDTGVQRYRFAGARDVAGRQLWIGIQEIGGRRTLDQLVAIPP